MSFSSAMKAFAGYAFVLAISAISVIAGEPVPPSSTEIAGIVAFKRRIETQDTIEAAKLSKQEKEWLRVAFVSELLEYDAEIEKVIEANESAEPLGEAIHELEEAAKLLPALKDDFTPKQQAQLTVNLHSLASIAERIEQESAENDDQTALKYSALLDRVSDFLVTLFPEEIVAKAKRVAAADTPTR